MHYREPRSEQSHQYDHAESRPPRIRTLNHQSRHHSDYHDSSYGDDEMPFSDYIMSVKLLRGFKPSTDMEPYDGSTGPQDHMDTFKSRMALARASDPVRCRAFPITLKKAILKWFNSLPPRSINKFLDLQSRFLAYFTTRRFKLKLVTGLLGLSQQ